MNNSVFSEQLDKSVSTAIQDSTSDDIDEKYEFIEMQQNDKIDYIALPKPTLSHLSRIAHDIIKVCLSLFNQISYQRFPECFFELENLLIQLLQLIYVLIDISQEKILTPDTLKDILLKHQDVAELFNNVCLHKFFSDKLTITYLNLVINNQLGNTLVLLQKIQKKDKKCISQKIQNNIIYLVYQFKVINAVVPYTLEGEKYCLFTSEQDSKTWQDFQKIFKVMYLNEPHKVKKNVGVLLSVVRQFTAFLSVVGSSDKLKNSIEFIKPKSYKSHLKKVKEYSKLYVSQFQEQVALKLLNFVESSVARNFFKVINQQIEFNETIYLPRILKSITLERILQEQKQDTLNKIVGTEGSQPQYLEIDPLDEVDIWTQSTDRISVKLLYYKKIQRYDNKQVFADLEANKNYKNNSLKSKLKQFFGLESTSVYTVENEISCPIIIHIHGGGFIAMSAGSHQNYTIKWANSLQIPVFSVDYRLAPEFPYPCALDDCWQAYNWILKNLRQTLGFNPTQIILVGDSAGGNLALGVAFRAIRENFTVPTSLFLIYPACSIAPCKFLPSSYATLTDALLPLPVLRMIQKYYIQHPDLKPETDPFLSPLYVSNEILKKMPPCRIVVATRDPLHDFSLKFARRLQLLGRDIFIKAYAEMPHGYMNFDMPNSLQEATVAVFDSIIIIKELINLNSNTKIA